MTVFYLPGTTGWGATFGRRPTALWTNPVIVEGTVAVREGTFGFMTAWAPTVSLVVEARADLGTLDWSPISTNTPAGGSWYFTDPDWGYHPTRFYRVLAP